MYLDYMDTDDAQMAACITTDDTWHGYAFIRNRLYWFLSGCGRTGRIKTNAVWADDFALPTNRKEDGMLRDPEDRPTRTEWELREKMLDKTLADSFPNSDPPSTIPNPSADDSLQESNNIPDQGIKEH